VPRREPASRRKARGATRGASGGRAPGELARQGGATAEPADRLVGLSFAVVDVETTGGSPWYGDRVTEVAAVVVRGGRVVDQFESLVNPERAIPPFISRLTQITEAMVRDQPTFREISPRVVEFLRGQVFVAHNAAFDWRFMGAEVGRAGGILRRRSLDQVAMHYGIRIEGRHRAMGDAMATARCLIRLLDDAGTRGLDTWSDLEHLMRARTGAARRRRRSVMPQVGIWELGA
jgi:DNA polymerase-3 subunit epsilon